MINSFRVDFNWSNENPICEKLLNVTLSSGKLFYKIQLHLELNHPEILIRNMNLQLFIWLISKTGGI